MSSYNGTELGDELVDGMLSHYGEERVDGSKYRLVETTRGVKVVEYDKDGESVRHKDFDVSKNKDIESYDDVIFDIEKGKRKSENIKYLRYMFISIVVMLFAIAIFLIIINK